MLPGKQGDFNEIIGLISALKLHVCRDREGSCNQRKCHPIQGHCRWEGRKTNIKIFIVSSQSVGSQDLAWLWKALLDHFINSTKKGTSCILAEKFLWLFSLTIFCKKITSQYYMSSLIGKLQFRDSRTSSSLLLLCSEEETTKRACSWCSFNTGQSAQAPGELNVLQSFIDPFTAQETWESFWKQYLYLKKGPHRMAKSMEMNLFLWKLIRRIKRKIHG